MSLSHLVRPDLVFAQVHADGRNDLLRRLAERLEATGFVRKAGKLLDLLLEREGLGSTGLGHGVAVPHCKMPGLSRSVLAVAACPDGVEFASADGRPARLVFLLVSPAASPADHLRSLAAISAWVKSHPDLDELASIDDGEELAQRLQERHPGDEPGT